MCVCVCVLFVCLFLIHIPHKLCCWDMFACFYCVFVLCVFLLFNFVKKKKKKKKKKHINNKVKT